ncbi:DUF4132 domain-containing protein [Nonomuraea sp. NPDC046570]|uniref:DUF4132 domain-containing protein n=1 Tax=Nonomuraea sp. NPDC046570 TaxID=3155255 RepID=UPI00340AAAAB
MSDDLVWVAATATHEIALDGTTLICRNSAGRRLKSVPKPARESRAAEDLLALRDYLARHEAECAATVESWMLGALPVPSAVIAEVWPDPSWRAKLVDLVLVPYPSGEPGLLRQVGDGGRIGVVNLDAETEWLEPGPVLIPHPVLLEDLDELREFAAELGAVQQVPQLSREVRHRQGRTGGRVGDYADGRFAELRHAVARAARYGFQVRGGYAICRVIDDGRPVQARYWLGADSPDYEALTGELIWVDADERPLDLAQVGPVAWSEGIRMAELIFAGRSTDDE